MASRTTHSDSVRASKKTYSKSTVRVISSKCAAWSCENNKKASDNVTYFQLPICDYGRCAIWLLNSARIDLVGVKTDQLSGYVICSNHFEASQFTHIHSNIGSRHLVWNAIPTIFGSSVAPISTSLVNCWPEETLDCTLLAATKITNTDVNLEISRISPPVKSGLGTTNFKDQIRALNLSRCCSCNNTYKECPTVTFFLFPTHDLSRFYSWIINCGQTNLLQRPKDWVQQNNLLCSDHFENSQFTDVDARDNLKPGAIPTIFPCLEPTIPAPKTFPKPTKRTMPPTLTKQQRSSPEQSSPKLTIVNTVSLAKVRKAKKVPFKVSVPQVSLLNPKQTDPQIQQKTIVPMKMQNKPTTVSTKLVVKSLATNLGLKSIPDTGSSTILIDSTGKPNSDHPLANVISMFLAQNKGHTGDLLITDGTPNGAKYLIRQNKTGNIKEATTPNQNLKSFPTKVTPKPVLTSVSPVGSKNSSPLLVDLRSSPSARSGQPPSPSKLVFLKSPTANTVSPTPVFKMPNQNGLATSKDGIKTLGPNDTITMLVPVSRPPQSNIPGSVQGTTASRLPVTMMLPMVTPATQSGLAPNITGGPVRMLIPVTPGTVPTSVKSNTTVQQKTVLAAPKIVSILNPGKLIPTSPQTSKIANQNPQPLPATENNLEGKKNIGTPTSTQPFTIVKKNTEAKKENGTTTSKSTFVIRGNGPLSSEQLEAIVRENLLKTGTIKDGAKILIRHKGAIPNNQGPDAVKNGTFMVRESKIVPMKQVPTEKKVVAMPKLPAAKAKAKAITTVQSVDTNPLSDHMPLFRYPKGMSPGKLAELRKSIRRHQVKICRQKKIIERLKLEKKEKVKNLPSDQLIRLVRKALPGFTGKFFEAQLQTSVRDAKKHGHRWDDDSKVFALGLWNRSPAAFKLMQRAFALPSLKTLSSWVASVPPEVDFFERLKEVLNKQNHSPKTSDTVNPTKEVVEEEEEGEHPDEDVDLEEELVQPTEMEEIAAEEEEPLNPNDESEVMFPDEEEHVQDNSMIEKMCIDLDAETGMHVVEEVVQDTDQALVESLIRVAHDTTISEQ